MAVSNNFLEASFIGGEVGSLISGGFSLANSLSQAKDIQLAGELEAQGDLFAAASFRASAQVVEQITEFNVEILQNNKFKQLQAVSRQYQRTIGNNLSAMATSNINIHSKSALMVQTEVADTFETALLDTKANFESQRQATIFESQAKQASLENQARASEYRAQADRIIASMKASEASSSGFGSFLSTVATVGATALLL